MDDKHFRNSGILLHISSLPGKEAIGTLGNEAYEFVDFLAKTKQSVWQILPLGHTGFGNSPYSSFSAFAGNPFLISLEKLGFDIKSLKLKFTSNKVDFEYVKHYKMSALIKLAKEFINTEITKDFMNFEHENNYWLHDYALFISIKQFYRCKSFSEFDRNIVIRENETIKNLEEKFNKEILINKVIQYFFFTQWKELKEYANSKSIEIFGDLPLYVAGDSADLWSKKENFYVDENLKPVEIAGVPPDYFSLTGQLWGNPVYNWNYLEKNDFNWWNKRLEHNLKLFDILRLDHFRGLVEYWAVKNESEDAKTGEWKKVPYEKFFEKIHGIFPDAKIIAEDLGFITEDVVKLRKKYKFPGMKILQFAFESGAKNGFLPHNYSYNYVAYSGTHDNDTIRGWFDKLNKKEKKYVKSFIFKNSKNVSESLIRLLWSSVAKTVIIPIQDLLNFGSETRMNIPGTKGNNWSWRLKPGIISEGKINFLINITEIYGRVKSE